MYTPEQIRQCISWLAGNFRVTADGKYRECADILAATLKAAQGGVTEAMVDKVWSTLMREEGEPRVATSSVRAALVELFNHCQGCLGLGGESGTACPDCNGTGKAALSAQQGEVVAWRFKLDDGSFQYGTAGHDVRIPRPIVEATPLYTAPPAQPAERLNGQIADHLISGLGKLGNTVSRKVADDIRMVIGAMKALSVDQPAERVPEASWLADQLCDLRNKWAEGCEANWLETDDNHPDDWMAKELRKRWIAASPAPSPARGDGGEIPDECPAGCNGGYFVETTTGAVDECQVCGGTGIDESQDTRP